MTRFPLSVNENIIFVELIHINIVLRLFQVIDFFAVVDFKPMQWEGLGDSDNLNPFTHRPDKIKLSKGIKFEDPAFTKPRALTVEGYKGLFGTAAYMPTINHSWQTEECFASWKAKHPKEKGWKMEYKDIDNDTIPDALVYNDTNELMGMNGVVLKKSKLATYYRDSKLLTRRAQSKAQYNDTYGGNISDIRKEWSKVVVKPIYDAMLGEYAEGVQSAIRQAAPMSKVAKVVLNVAIVDDLDNEFAANYRIAKTAANHATLHKSKVFQVELKRRVDACVQLIKDNNVEFKQYIASIVDQVLAANTEGWNVDQSAGALVDAANTRRARERGAEKVPEWQQQGATPDDALAWFEEHDANWQEAAFRIIAGERAKSLIPRYGLKTITEINENWMLIKKAKHAGEQRARQQQQQ